MKGFCATMHPPFPSFPGALTPRLYPFRGVTPDTREVDPQEVVDPAAAVAQGDPVLGPVHPHLGVLAAERLAQLVQARPPGQVAGVPPGGGLSSRIVPPGLGPGREDLADPGHPPLGLDAASTLDRHDGGVDAHYVLKPRPLAV
jgi:hypothetical protein